MRIQKRKNIGFMVTVFISALLYAAESADTFSLEIQPLFQYRKTTIGEYVFTKEGETTTLLSDLNWSLQNIYLAGSAVSYSKNRFTAHLSVLLGIPSVSGTMSDSDFYTSSPEPSLFSYHDASIKALLDVNLNAGYEFVNDEKVSITGYTGFQYNETGATSYNGYFINYLYEIPVIQRMSGQMISYTQYLLFTWLGSVWKIRPSDSVLVTFSAAYSPFCFAKGWDIHHLRSVEFLDSMMSFYALKGGISLSLFVTKCLSLGIGVEGLYLPLCIGVTGMKEENGNAFFEQSGYAGGTRLSEARFSASVQYKFSK